MVPACKVCLKCFLIAVIPLIVFSHAAFSLEEEPIPVFAIKFQHFQNLIKNFLNMPEILPVQKAYGEIFEKILSNEPLVSLSKNQEICISWFFSSNEKAESFIFLNGNLVSKKAYFDPGFEAIFGSGHFQPLIDAEKSPKLPDFSGANPSDEITGWLSPKNLSKSLRIAFTHDCQFSFEKSKRKCESNRRIIKKSLDKTNASSSFDMDSINSQFKCPFAGNYFSNSSSPPNASNAGFEILCNHKMPMEPKLNQIPETPLAEKLAPFLSVLNELPDLEFRLNSSDGIFSIELPAESSKKTDLEVPEEKHRENPMLKLEWIDSKNVSFPISERIPSAVFLGLNPFLLESFPEIPALAKKVPSGIFLVSGSGAEIGAIFRGRSNSIPVAIGISDKENLVQNFLIEQMFRKDAQTKTSEEEGFVFPIVEVSKRPWEEETMRIGIMECDGLKYFALNKDIQKALVRIMNGEDKRVDFLKKLNLGEKIKFATAFRLDTLGELVSMGASIMMFEEEARKCYEGFAKFVQGKFARDMETITMGGVPPDLEKACPRNGFMVKDKRIFCAVHERRWGNDRSAPCRVNVDLPRNRWFAMVLAKRNGKALLEAKIISPTEESK